MGKHHCKKCGGEFRSNLDWVNKEYCKPCWLEQCGSSKNAEQNVRTTFTRKPFIIAWAILACIIVLFPPTSYYGSFSDRTGRKLRDYEKLPSEYYETVSGFRDTKEPGYLQKWHLRWEPIWEKHRHGIDTRVAFAECLIFMIMGITGVLVRGRHTASAPAVASGHGVPINSDGEPPAAPPG